MRFCSPAKSSMEQMVAVRVAESGFGAGFCRRVSGWQVRARKDDKEVVGCRGSGWLVSGLGESRKAVGEEEMRW